MDSPNLSTMMASYWPQNTQEALSLLRDRSINMRTPSDAMPDSAAQFFDTIDTLPRLFAACDTFDLVSDAVEKAADGGVKKAWTRATSCNMPELSKWTARSLPDWLRLVNYPVLNAVFGESEMNGLITSSTNKVWLAIEEPWSASAWPSTWSTYPRYTRGLPGSRTEVVYGLPYGPSSNPINHQMSSLRDLDSLSRLALDKLQQRHWPSLRFTPCSENDEETPLFPGIIYAAQASELDMCKSEIRAAAAAAKALQLLENLMRTSDLMSSSPVVAIVVSAGPLWRIHFATSSVVGGDIDKPSYDIYRSRKLDLYIDDIGDRLRLFVILANLERWLRVTHESWVRRHTAALWASYLEESFEDSTVDISGDNEEATEDLYEEDSEAAASDAGSSEADDWLGQNWAAGPGEGEDWVTQAQFAALEARMIMGNM